MPLADGTIVELTKLFAIIPSARLHVYIPVTMPREKIFGTLRSLGANWTVDRMRCPSPELIETMQNKIQDWVTRQMYGVFVGGLVHDTNTIRICYIFEFTGNTSVTEALTRRGFFDHEREISHNFAGICMPTHSGSEATHALGDLCTGSISLAMHFSSAVHESRKYVLLKILHELTRPDTWASEAEIGAVLYEGAFGPLKGPTESGRLAE
ncbi:hypothetical protein CPB85DRAFT_1565093 [Mucidula mucida]|nr:hypothetical protein CPB85DRAFT_1565093 [Mucidula mucida]